VPCVLTFPVPSFLQVPSRPPTVGRFSIIDSTQVLRCILLSNFAIPVPSLDVTCDVPYIHSTISEYLGQLCRTQRCRSKLRYGNGLSSRRGDGITGENYTLHHTNDPELEFEPVPPRLAAATTAAASPQCVEYHSASRIRGRGSKHRSGWIAIGFLNPLMFNI